MCQREKRDPKAHMGRRCPDLLASACSRSLAGSMRRPFASTLAGVGVMRRPTHCVLDRPAGLVADQESSKPFGGGIHKRSVFLAEPKALSASHLHCDSGLLLAGATPIPPRFSPRVVCRGGSDCTCEEITAPCLRLAVGDLILFSISLHLPAASVCNAASTAASSAYWD